MATPSRYLIDLLLRTADDIETNPDYRWVDAKNCNCGLLAKNAGVDPASDTAWGSWENRALDCVCAQTGVHLDKAVKALIEIGFSAEDICELETCSNLKVLELLGKTPLEVDKKDLEGDRTFVSKYLRTWAFILDKQLVEQTLSDQQPVKQKVRVTNAT